LIFLDKQGYLKTWVIETICIVPTMSILLGFILISFPLTEINI